MFEEFDVAKKCRFKALQRESSLDGWVEEMGLLQHLEQIEDLVAYGLVLDDLVAEQGGAEILRREAYNQLVMREFLYEQFDGFLPAGVVIEAVPGEAVFSSHVIGCGLMLSL